LHGPEILHAPIVFVQFLRYIPTRKSPYVSLIEWWTIGLHLVGCAGNLASTAPMFISLRTPRRKWFSLLSMLLDSSSPVILYLVVGPPWKMLCNFRPPRRAKNFLLVSSFMICIWLCLRRNLKKKKNSRNQVWGRTCFQKLFDQYVNQLKIL
jgi:hypothetical protein